MNPIIYCNIHQDPNTLSFPSRSSSSNQPPFSWPFQQGSYQGVLLIDQIKQIQAYLKNEQGAFVPAQFVSPFTNLFFTTKKQLEIFGSTFPNYYVRVAPLEDGDFKVYLYPKMAGGTLTEMQEAELKEADLFKSQGIQARKDGKLDEAICFFKKSLEIRIRHDPHSKEADSSHYFLAELFVRQSNFKDALKHCKESLQILKHFPSDIRRRCTSHNHIGYVYWRLRDFTYALSHFQTSLSLSKFTDLDSSELGGIYKNIAWVYRNLADAGNALTYFKVSLEFFRKHDTYSPWESIICDQLSRLYASEGKIEEAFDYSHQALEIDMKVNSDSSTLDALDRLARWHVNVGYLYGWQGKYTLAEEHLNKSLEILKRIKPMSVNVAEILFRFAMMYLSRGMPLETLPYLEEIFAIRKAHDSKKSAVKKSDNSRKSEVDEVCEDILEQYNPHIEFMEAFFLLCGGFQIGQKIDLYSPLRAKIYCDMAEASFFCGKFAEALPDFEKAYSIWKRKLSVQHSSVRYSGIMIAQTAFKLGDYKKAFEYATITKNNDPGYKYAYISLGLILKNQGKLKDALTEFNRALKCDSGYADAIIYRLEVLLELYRLEVLADPEKKGKDKQGIAASIAQARQLPPTSYVVQEKISIMITADAIAEATDEKGIRRLPKAVYKSDSMEYMQKISELGKEFVSLFAPRSMNSNSQASPASRVEASSSSSQNRRPDLRVDTNLDTVQKSLKKIDATKASTAQMNSQNKNVHAEKEAEKPRIFTSTSVLSEMEADYLLAAQVVESEDDAK